MFILRLVYLLIPVVLVTCSQHSQVLATQFQDPGNASSYFKNSPCPVAEDIAPCVCTYVEDAGAMDMDCTSVADEQELYKVFHANIQFPKFRRLDLVTNQMETLSDTVFGDATFEVVNTSLGTPGTITSVGPKTFIKSVATLRVLYLHSNQLSGFPIETLSQYTHLTSFSLYRNPVLSFPIIQSETISFIDLGTAAYHTIPADALDGLPNLKYFRVRTMNIESMATGIFTSLPNLVEILMQETGLTHLKSLQFGVNSSVMNIIDLHANQIETVDVDAFRGVQSGTIDMSNNQLTILPEATWRSLMDAGVHLKLEGNDLTCGCDVGWLVLEPTFHVLVEDAVCHNGDMLVDLDPSYFENFC